MKCDSLSLDKRKLQQQMEELAKLYAEQQSKQEALLAQKRALRLQMDQKNSPNSSPGKTYLPETKQLRNNKIYSQSSSFGDKSNGTNKETIV